MLLETERLLIRDVTGADADRFDSYMADKAYWRLLPIDPPTPRSVKAFIDQVLRDQREDPRSSYFLAATSRPSGLVVGEGSLQVRSARWAEGEIGWGIDPAYAGKGLATEIAGALLAFAFEVLDLHRIYARCRADHGASRRIMSKLGMREEGVLRENVLARGEWWSSLQAAILADEWRARQGLRP